MLPHLGLASLQAAAGVRKKLTIHDHQARYLNHVQFTLKQQGTFATRLFIAIQLLFRLENEAHPNPVYLGNFGNLVALGLICQGPPQGPRHLPHEAHPQVRLLTPPPLLWYLEL